MNRILVPLDGSDNSFRALDLAVLIANKFNSKIEILHVINTIPLNLVHSEYDIALTPDMYIQYVKAMKEKGNGILEKAYKHAKNMGANLEITTKLVEGKPADMIIQESEKMNIDHIILGSRGVGKIQELLLGSVSRAVVHRSKVPVTIVK